MKRFDIEAPVGNKTINCWKVGRYFAYYFTQSTYTFLLLTQEDKVQMRKTQRRLRINKYLNTIAEMFYEEYDEDNFKKVLKYAVVVWLTNGRKRSTRQKWVSSHPR